MAELIPTSRAVHRHQGAARVAGIDRGVGLDEEVEVADADRRPRQCRNDAAGHRLPDTEGIADRQHKVAHFKVVAVVERQERQLFSPWRRDPQDREVGLAVGRDHLGLELPPVRQHDGYLIAVLDDMVVGDDQPVSGHDDAGAERPLDPLSGHAQRIGLPEEALEEGIVEQRRNPLLDHAPGIDIDDGRSRLLDQRRERQGDLLARIGQSPLLGETGTREPKQGDEDKR